VEALLFSEVIRTQARQRGSSVAMRINGEDLSFGALDRRASQAAQGLLAAGCRPGSRVAILSKNSRAFVEVLGGALKARAVLLALNWRLAAPELRYILEHGEAEALFVEPEFLPLAEAAMDALRPPGLVVALGGPAGSAPAFEAWRDAQSGDDPALGGDPSEVFVQMYTSGTTGLPKGVQLTHANYAACFAAMNQRPWSVAGPEDTLFAPAPFFHVNGLNGILRSLASGSRLLSTDQFRPAQVVDLFERERVTRTSLAPAMIQMCLEVPGVAERDFSAMKLITYGGSPISETVLKRAREVFRCGFAQGYGMTETSGPLTMLSPEDHRDDSRLISCGQPLPGIEVRVVRPDGSDCAPREIGEVTARGPMVTTGYWKDPEATARTIRDGWMHTGDAGYFDETGYLHIHDRLKEMIVSGGENVYPAEVENALAKDPDIADVAVIGVPDERWGEAVKAIVVLRPGAEPSPEAIIGRVRRHIAGYKAPKSVDFVDTIPRNPSGKILRRDLRAPYWADRARAVN
jgi:acyl-CoA synthetase (AMP-forming)/AMP-acid ligase II